MAPVAGMDTALDQHAGHGSEFWQSLAQARSWDITSGQTLSERSLGQLKWSLFSLSTLLLLVEHLMRAGRGDTTGRKSLPSWSPCFQGMTPLHLGPPCPDPRPVRTCAFSGSDSSSKSLIISWEKQLERN